MKKLSFILVLLLVSTFIVFAQEKPLRGYSLFEHNPKEGVYKRFFGENSYDKAPIQEFYVVQNEEGGIELYVGFVGDASNLMKKYSEEKVEKSPVLEGKQSTIYTYIFSGTPITINIIEVYTLSTKKTECLISFKSYNEIIYFAKARKIAKAKMEKIIKDQLVKERAKAEEQKRIEEEKRQKEKQEELKRQVQEKAKIEKIKTFEMGIGDSMKDSLVKENVINALIRNAFRTFVAGSKIQCDNPEVVFGMDSLGKIQIIAIIIDYKYEVINRDLFNAYARRKKYLRFGNNDYYNTDEKIFTERYSSVNVMIELYEIKVKNKNRKLSFDKRCGVIPNEIKEWCYANLKENGTFVIQYTKCDNRYTATKLKIK